ncbi:response regulator [Asticcacaulis solisilvae]|uniref:response regulator n=1 Tax=Asticcacaulis solisilvae TaxID=1217274 RepID=UPI003FD8AB62
MDGERHLLIVDDDDQLRDQISRYLDDNGYIVHTAANAAAMDAVLAECPVDLIVLDVSMPGEDGLSVCRRLNMSGGPAVIMASAAGEETDRVVGLELGADDYLPKPFSPRELLARVRAVLRRRDDSGGALRRGQVYRFAEFSFDPARRQLRSPSGAMILLTAGEGALLSALLAQPRTPLMREDLNAAEGPGSTGRGVDIAVSRLRKKLEAHGGGDILRTQRGQGYLLDCVVTRA